MKYQFIENENFVKNADFENCQVYLMNKTQDNYEYPSELNINEVSQSFEPDTVKFPKMLTFANEHYLNNYSKEGTQTDENGNEYPITVFTEPFEYEIITDDENKYTFTAYVCDKNSINVIKEETTTEETETTEGDIDTTEEVSQSEDTTETVISSEDEITE